MDPVMDVLVTLFMAIVLYIGVGFLTFVSLVKSQLGDDWGWLHTLSEKFGFFLSPLPPENMVVLVELDGKTSVYYNVKIEKIRNGWEIQLPHAKFYAPKIKESWTDLLGSNYPVKQSTPYNLAIRAIGGLMTGAYMVYLTAVMGFASSSIGEAILAAATILAVLYTLLAYRQALVPNLKVVEIVEWGHSSPTGHYAIPSIGPRGMSPIEFAQLQGYELKVEVPKEVQELFNKLKERLQRDDLALAKLLAKAEESERLKIEIGHLKKSAIYSKELARSYILQSAFKITLTRAIVMAVVFCLGVLIGWALFGGGDVVITSHPLINGTTVVGGG